MKHNKAKMIGFVTGFVGTFVVTFAALIFPIEFFSDIFLYFPRLILSPLNEAMASWPGLVNMLLGAAINGVLFMLIFWLVAGIFLNRNAIK